MGKNLEKLKRFWQVYQHTEVPLIWKTDQVLATWVNKVRSLKIKLTDELLKELVELDFNFNSGLNYEWDLMYEKLLSFNRKFGHFDIQSDSKYKELLTWVENQRKVGKYLSDRKIKLLKELKLPWFSTHIEPNDLLWDKKFEELVEFKKSFGHCNVPARWKKNHSLAIWVFKHRQKEEKGILRKDRKDKLDAIGFAWRKDLKTQEENLWNQRFEELKRFKTKYGHTKVPGKKTGEYFKLYLWIQYQKFLKNRSFLSAERIEKLNSLDFIWLNIPNVKWEKMFKQLLDYKAKYGHAIISYNHKQPNPLSIWARYQRKYWKNGTLKKDQINKLENLGFKLSNDTTSSKWLTMFNSLVDFKHVHGHVDVPADVNEYTLLYLWSMKQKYYYREDWLDNEKVSLLKRIGFKFNS